MDCHIVPHLAPLQLVLQVSLDELNGLIQRKPAVREKGNKPICMKAEQYQSPFLKHTEAICKELHLTFMIELPRLKRLKGSHFHEASPRMM